MKYLFLFFTLLICISCDNGPTFSWNPEIETIVNGDIDSWLKTAPFSGIWDPNDNSEGNVYFTNTREVFPFMGEFKNEDDNLILVNKKAKPFYKEQFKVFKDDTWGESVVYAGLLYKTEELFMQPSYSKSGNLLVDGIASMNSRNYASLQETKIIANNTSYKTGIYWVTANQKDYLMGFYQKGQLAFQVAFPCTLNQKKEGLQQLATIARKMNLNIPEWNNSTVEQLSIKENSVSFWEDPFEKLSFGKAFIPSLRIKLKGTVFQNKKITSKRTENGDEYLIKDTSNSHTLIIRKEKTTLSSLDFSESSDAITFENTANFNRAFHNKTIEQNGITTQTAKTYFKDNTLFVFKYSYPTSNVENTEVLEHILGTIKINTF